MKKMNILLGGAIAFAALNVGNYAFASDNPFATVPQKTGYYQDVASLIHDGLIDGYTDSDFSATRPMTRYEMAIFTAKAMSKSGSAGAEDTQRIQRLMKEFQSELTDLHVKVPGVKAKQADTKAAKGPKIKRLPNNIDFSGLMRFRFDDGFSKSRAGKLNKGKYGGPDDRTLTWNLFTKFDIGAGWKGNLEFIGGKNYDSDSRKPGENTTGYAEANKMFATGPLFGTQARIGLTKNSTIYKQSMVMNAYFTGVTLTKAYADKWKSSFAYGKVDHKTGRENNRSNIDSDLNPQYIGVEMLEFQTAYQASPKLQLNMGAWHLINRDANRNTSKQYQLNTETGDTETISKVGDGWIGHKGVSYPNPYIGEVGFQWNPTSKWAIFGHYAQSNVHYTRFSDHSKQNKGYSLTFRYGVAKETNPNSSQLQLDLIHQERYAGIKSSYDLKNKTGEGQRGFILDYRYVPLKNIKLDLRWMHYDTIGKSKYSSNEVVNQYRAQIYYYF